MCPEGLEKDMVLAILRQFCTVSVKQRLYASFLAVLFCPTFLPAVLCGNQHYVAFLVQAVLENL